MAIWPFNRKQGEQSTLPEEVQEYYASTRKQRVGIAWLLALATLVVTVLLTIGIFYGGKWVLQRFSDDTGPTQIVEEPVGQPRDPQADTSEQPSTASEDKPNQEPQQPTRLPADQNESSAPPVSAAETSKDVPNTGPGDIVAIFVVTSICATMAHAIYVRKRA